MNNNIPKSTFIFSLIITILLTYIVTREITISQFSSTPVNTISNEERVEPFKTKAKDVTGKDGQQADPYEKEQVKNTIIKNAKKIQECYSKWLETKPQSPKANIKMDWTILPNGTVQNPQVIDSDVPSMNECLIGKVTEIEFPYPPEGKAFYVAHKFNFNTEENLEKIKKEQEEMEKKFNPLKK